MNTDMSEINKNILKSSTSLVSLICKDGIIMGADRRVTAGNVIMSKKEQKVQQLNDYLVLSWTGGAADAALSQKIITAELKLKELKTKARPSIKESANFIGMMFYRNIRAPSMIPHMVGALVGGVNEDGSTELFTIEPAGGVYPVTDFDANFSSGMPYILGLLERQWKPGMTIQQGVDLALEALKSSTQRDSGSGNGIDIFTITKEGIKHVVSKEILPNYQ